MKKYNMKNIMKSAWKFVKANRANGMDEALRMAWYNAKLVVAAQEKHETELRTHTEWKEVGRVVIHGQHCVEQIVVNDSKTKNGKRTLSFFTYEQTCPIEEQD